MYKVMIKMRFGYDDAIHCEYSGIEHDTIQEANKEYLEALEENIDNDMLHYIYVEEV